MYIKIGTVQRRLVLPCQIKPALVKHVIAFMHYGGHVSKHEATQEELSASPAHCYRACVKHQGWESVEQSVDDCIDKVVFV